MAALALAQPEVSIKAGLAIDADHVYTFNGVVVPGVTGSLQQCGLIDFTGIPKNVLDAAAERGTRVHRALEYLDLGTLDRANLAPEYEGYLRGYEEFCSETGFTVLEVEARKFNPSRRYAGMVDRVGLIDDGLTILDFKSGAVQFGHRLQLTGYAHFFPNPRRFRRIALQLFPDGRKKVHEYSPSTFDYDTNLFFSAINCAHGRLQMRNR